MATERIQIIISERGSREVRRNLDEIGSTATKAEGALSLLKSTLGTLSVGFLVAGLVRLADTYTNIQNRLRLVTSDTANLNSVMTELFAISNRTRSSFEGTAQLYARVALSAKTLGRSQKELLQFTESLNQAVILSGASAREAEGAIIQLSQGLASGTLQGDELRSVLEQLPYVADVIARYLGVTRGELRKMGADGKISGEAVLNAFTAARVELAENFAKTIPTIGQSIGVFRNRFIELWGEFSQSSGLALLLASSIVKLSENLGTLVQVLTAVTAVFISRWIATALIGGATAVSAYVSTQIALNLALGSTSVAAAAAATGMKVFQLALATVLSTAVLLTAGIAALVFGLTSLAANTMESNKVIAGLQETSRTAANDLWDLEAKARDAGMNVDSLTNAAATGNPVLIQIATSYGQAADQAQRLAENARQAAIAVAQGKISELKAQRDTLMQPINDAYSSNPLRQVRGGWQHIYDSVAGGPSRYEREKQAAQLNDTIGIYGQQIALLQQVPDAVFQPEPYQAPPGKPKKTGGAGPSGRSDADILAEFNAQMRDEIELAGLAGAAQEKRSAILQLQRQLGGELTADENERTSGLLDQLTAVQDLAAFKEWSDSMRQETALLGLTNRERERQEELLRLEFQRKRQLTDAEKDLAAARVLERQAARDTQQVNQYLKQLDDENTLLSLNADERARRAAMMQLEAQLERELTEAEATPIRNKVDLNSALRDQAQMLDNIKGPMEDVVRGQQALNALYSDGKIELRDYRAAMVELQLAALENFQPMNFSEAFVQQWAIMQTVADQALISIGTKVGEIFGPGGTLIKGIGDAVAGAIVFGESFSESINNVARQILAQLISSLVQVGLNMILQATLGKALMASSVAASVTAASTTAAAWAPAAALASLATLGTNAVPAAAALIGTTAISAGLSTLSTGLPGFEKGGFTGTAGRSSVTGVVHGQEFVAHAEATRRWRPELEAMNRGDYSPSGNLNVRVSNYAPGVEHEVVQRSDGEIEIIARKVMQREAPALIASDLSQPNSRTRKALEANTTAQARRG